MRYVLAYCQVRGRRKAVCTKSPTTLWTKSLVCFRHISASVNVHLKKPKQTKNLNFKEECSVRLHLPPVFSFKHPQNSVTHTHTHSPHWSQLQAGLVSSNITPSSPITGCISPSPSLFPSPLDSTFFSTPPPFQVLGSAWQSPTLSN